MQQKQQRRWLWAGVTGSVVAALCCFTPILVLFLGAVGLGALTGYLDLVVLPALVLFLAMAAYGLSAHRNAKAEACCGVQPNTPAAPNRTREDAHG